MLRLPLWRRQILPRMIKLFFCHENLAHKSKRVWTCIYTYDREDALFHLLCNRGIQYIDRDRGTLVDVKNVHLRVDIEATHLDRRRSIDITFLPSLPTGPHQ